jgi:hypothetical protein
MMQIKYLLAEEIIHNGSVNDPPLDDFQQISPQNWGFL